MLKKHYIALASLFVGIAVLSGGALVADASAEKSANEKVRVFVHFDGTPGKSEQASIRSMGGEVRHSYKSVNALAVEIPEQALKGLENNPRVTLIEEDHVMQATTIVEEYDRTWSIANIHADDAHNMTPTVKGAGVKVGVIDSGVDYYHQDLSAQYRGGYDFVEEDSEPMDVYGHGTHVAGTICASLDGVGIVGVAPECDLYSLRVLNDDGYGTESDIVAAIEWALDNELDIVNLSLGRVSAYTEVSEAVFNNAYESGLVIVAAAGNESNDRVTRRDNVIYPAKYDSVIAVAATDADDEWAYFSSVGDDVEISAPGLGVLSTWNDDTSHYTPYPYLIDGGYYKEGSGTSMASPQVAGVAALLIGAGIVDVSRTHGVADDVRTVLTETARYLGDARQFGAGLVDALAAVSAIDTTVPDNYAPVAEAGEDQMIVDTEGDGETFELNGSASTDDKDAIVSYKWSYISEEVNTEVVVGEEAKVTLFDKEVGEYEYTLTVTDAEDLTDTDTVLVTIEAYVEEPTKCTPGMLKKGECLAVNIR